ncbi:UDP-2,3-diacylglucosamine diphosphatase [Jiulongibacter sediminis]|jgi:UDP-2,3-diacylglucosamine pyrophosphatase LpxH|uniref:Phosphoesterase n=1 Tax=Jiulongibacter sediminis TaxID=1605367 RepID=A0A0N8HAF3_9BACT|nr:UDP-2,3-diacylglucosamine diphosphatase [Jiulongibacter sediminis]KPM50012.1 phosphoesterase [Jiulongibacter sediminis]TBX27040.1 phosphoesterase [Jiulongibacter sediminis]
MQSQHHFKTIVLSDIHLGTAGSKAREVTSFIKQYSCERLILNGDIIDGWQLKKYGSWKKRHTAFLRAILKTIEKKDTKVYYLRGNHDDFLDQILPFSIGPNFKILKELTIESGDKKYYVVHGDIFDLVTKKAKWLAHIGDLGYTFLLWVNKKYNHYRRSKGLAYYSLSKRVKQSIKVAVNYVSDFEEQLAELARSKNCDGIICGHIHQPAIKTFNQIKYMNSGDWVENLSALVEDHNGNWEIVYYSVQKKYQEYDEEAISKRYQKDFDDNESDIDFSYSDLFNLK